MKKIKRNTSKKRTIFIVIFSFLLFSTGVGFYLLYANVIHTNSTTTEPSKTKPLPDTSYVNTDPATGDQLSAGEQTKKDSVTQQSTQDTVAGDITTANQVDDMIHIRAIIHDVTSSGTCILTITADSGKTYSEKSGTQPLPTSSTCKGFNVPTSSLPLGDWSISIEYINGNNRITMNRKITVQ